MCCVSVTSHTPATTDPRAVMSNVYDTLRDSMDALMTGDTGAVRTVDSGAVGATVSADDVSIPHNFCRRLRRLLQVLYEVFPEREKLGTWMGMFDMTVMGIPAMEKFVIERWHYDMTHDSENVRYDVSLYERTKARDIDALLSSNLWVFREIDAHDLYYDPELDADDRAMICTHFDSINDCARMYAMLPPGFAEIAQDVARTVDMSQPITTETTHAVMQRVMGMVPAMLGGDPENTEKMISWATQLGQTFTDGSSLDMLQSLIGEGTLKQLAPDLDIASLMMGMQRDVAEAVSGSDGPLDGATMMSIIQSQAAKLL